MHNKTLFMRLALICLLLMAPLSQALASDPPTDMPTRYAVGRIFEKYALNKKATLVNLDRTALSDQRTRRSWNNGQLNRMIVLTLQSPTLGMVQDVEQAIIADKKGSADIQEVFAQGYLVSAYYKLSQADKLSTYLLYRYDETKNHIVLIYLEGEVSSAQLLRILRIKR